MSTRVIMAAAVLAVAVPVGAAPAAAGDHHEERRGECGDSATWRLKGTPQEGRIHVEGRVDDTRSGDVWRWRLDHNGDPSAWGRATTDERTGSFEVRRHMVDVRGTDRLRFRAVNTETGTVCVGRITF